MFAFIIIETIMYYICICITLHYVRNYIFKKKLWLLIIPVLYSILTVLNYLITKDTTNFISFFIIFLFLLSSKFIFKNSKFSTIVITTLPITIIYPFFQKHFVQGVMIGAVKSWWHKKDYSYGRRKWGKYGKI